MSIASEISRLQSAKAALATSIAAKGVTVPAATKLDGYSALVDDIQTGGGGVQTTAVTMGTAEKWYTDENMTVQHSYAALEGVMCATGTIIFVSGVVEPGWQPTGVLAIETGRSYSVYQVI